MGIYQICLCCNKQLTAFLTLLQFFAFYFANHKVISTGLHCHNVPRDGVCMWLHRNGLLLSLTCLRTLTAQLCDAIWSFRCASASFTATQSQPSQTLPGVMSRYSSISAVWPAERKLKSCCWYYGRYS